MLKSDNVTVFLLINKHGLLEGFNSDPAQKTFPHTGFVCKLGPLNG